MPDFRNPLISPRSQAVGLSRHLASGDGPLMAAAAELVEDLGKIFGGRNGGRNSGGWWVLGKCGHKGSMVKLSLWMIYMRVIPLNNGGEANIFRGLWDVMWIFAVSSVQFIHLGCIILGVPLIWTTPKYTHTYVQVYIYIYIYIYICIHMMLCILPVC